MNSGKLHSSRKGDRAELLACVFLIDQGYEVFRNVTCTGPADLIALNIETGECKLIDVKNVTRSIHNDKEYVVALKKTPLQIGLKVEFLYIDACGTCSWNLPSITEVS